MSNEAPSHGKPAASFTLTDAAGVKIVVHEWQAKHPHAIVQIAHGIGEHSGRYRAFAELLTQNGFTVYADDHRGHGETGRGQYQGDLSKLGKLGPGGLRAAEAAILQLTKHIRLMHNGLPVIMFGHSWGSLMVQRIINQEKRPFDAVVLSGSAYRTPMYMESGDLNKKWRSPDATGFEWLSRDPATATAFLADELCFAANIPKLFGLADSARLLGTPSRNVATDVPMLIVSGGDDPLNKGKGLRLLAGVYAKQGVTNLTLKMYPGARHELLNETNKHEVSAELVTWMLDQFPRP